MDPLFDDLHDTVELLRRHAESQESLITSMTETTTNLYTALDTRPRPGWMDILAAVIVAFAYGAWFGVVQCPK